MGFSPREVNEMTPWEFDCLVDGWTRAHNPERKEELPTMSEEEFREFMYGD